MKWNGYEAQHISLLHVFVIMFGIEHAKATMRFGKMLEQLTNRNTPISLFNYRSVNVKQQIVHSCGPSNIDCSSFVVAFKV